MSGVGRYSHTFTAVPVVRARGGPVEEGPGGGAWGRSRAILRGLRLAAAQLAGR